MENDNPIVGRECVFATHLEAIPDVRDDTHLVKEIIHFKDGTRKRNLRVVKNYQRPFWITKEHYQNHKQKKESESLDKVNRYLSTQSDLGKNVASRLGGRYIGRKSLRDVCDSPYVYGLDVNAATMIKEQYQSKYPDCITPLSVAIYDTEVDTYNEEIVIATTAMKGKIYTGILSRIIPNKKDLYDRLKYIYNKHIPKTQFTENVEIEYVLFDNEIDLVIATINKAHEWQPDILAMWNAKYDVEHIIDACERANVDPKDIFSDPSLPPELRHFKLKYGATSKLTESGKYTPLAGHEQWHTYTAASSFYIIDAMATYNYVRVNTKAVPGGYSLDNILKQELGDGYQKLKFLSEETLHLHGIDWHRYMLAKQPLEYVIYNQYDCLSMLILDNKTKDLETNLSTLIGCSSFDIFNSGPKKIVNGLHFFYLSNNQVLGSKPSRRDDDKVLGLDNWINKLNTINQPIVY